MELALPSNVVVWSCDRLKYCKIMAGIYQEELVRKENIQWHLRTVPPSDFEDFERWVYFYLVVSGGALTCNVAARVTSRKKLIKNTVLNFTPTKQIKKIMDVDFDALENFYMDIAFKFPDVVENLQPIPQIIEKENEKEITYVHREIEINQIDDLAKDFQAILKDEDTTDLTIKCKDESAILKVHKCVLRARSPVFKVMLSSPMQESSSDIVVTDDIDGEILQSMIQFIYSGQLKIISMNMASGLLYAAEKYQIESLKKGIIQYLETNLCEANAVEILGLVDLYDEHYKAKVIQYISENFNNLKHTKEWKELKSEKPVLALEVYTYNDSK